MGEPGEELLGQPSSVSLDFDKSVTYLQRAAADSGAARKALVANNISATDAASKQAKADEQAFKAAMTSIGQHCD